MAEIEKEDTSRLIWSDDVGYRDIFLHEEGAIGFKVNGRVYWKSIDDWVETHELSVRYATELSKARARIRKLEVAIADKLIKDTHNETIHL